MNYKHIGQIYLVRKGILLLVVGRSEKFILTYHLTQIF